MSRFLFSTTVVITISEKRNWRICKGWWRRCSVGNCYFCRRNKEKNLLFNYKRSNKSVSFESKRRKRHFKTVTRSVFSAIYLDPLRADLNFSDLNSPLVFQVRGTTTTPLSSRRFSRARRPRICRSGKRGEEAFGGVGRAAKWLINRR